MWECHRKKQKTRRPAGWPAFASCCGWFAVWVQELSAAGLGSFPGPGRTGPWLFHGTGLRGGMRLGAADGLASRRGLAGSGGRLRLGGRGPWRCYRPRRGLSVGSAGGSGGSYRSRFGFGSWLSGCSPGRGHRPRLSFRPRLGCGCPWRGNGPGLGFSSGLACRPRRSCCARLSFSPGRGRVICRGGIGVCTLGFSIGAGRGSGMCTGTAIGGRDGLGADMLLGNLVVGVYAGRSHGCGAAVIDGGELGAVLAGEGLVLHLVRSGLYVALVGKLRFLYTRPAIDAAGAIEAGVVVVDDGVLLDDGSVDVDVGDVNAA